MLKAFYSIIVPAAKSNRLQKIYNKMVEKLAALIYRVKCDLYNPIARQNQTICNDVIVSLTTFPKRIDTTYYCICSLVNQTVKPEKIILWLASSEFPDMEESLPKRILRLRENGLIIKFCDNIRSYKKIYYTAKEYSNKSIITADDDVLYPENWLESLIVAHSDNPNDIICHRAHKITMNDKELFPYKDWISLSPDETGPSISLIAIGVGGILYPAGFFEELPFDEKDFMKLAPFSDDIFLKAYEVKKRVKVKKVKANNKEMFMILGSQKERLSIVNVENNDANDVAMKKSMDFFSLTMADFKE